VRLSLVSLKATCLDLITRQDRDIGNARVWRGKHIKFKAVGRHTPYERMSDIHKALHTYHHQHIIAQAKHTQRYANRSRQKFYLSIDSSSWSIKGPIDWHWSITHTGNTHKYNTINITHSIYEGCTTLIIKLLYWCTTSKLQQVHNFGTYWQVINNVNISLSSQLLLD